MSTSITGIVLTDAIMTAGLALQLQQCRQLERLTMCSMDLQDHLIQPPNSITYIDLQRVTLSVRNVLALAEQLEDLSHDATCELMECQVEPSNKHSLVEQRLFLSSKLHVDKYDPKGFNMTHQKARSRAVTTVLNLKCIDIYKYGTHVLMVAV